MSKILGKVVVVDELSLRKEEEVRVKVKCLDSSKLRTMLRVFFNDDEYDLAICPEPPNHIGRPRFSDDSHLGAVQLTPTTPTTSGPATPPSTTLRMTRTCQSTPAPCPASPPTHLRVMAVPRRDVLEICPRGNNKLVIIIFPCS